MVTEPKAGFKTPGPVLHDKIDCAIAMDCPIDQSLSNTLIYKEVCLFEPWFNQSSLIANL